MREKNSEVLYKLSEPRNNTVIAVKLEFSGLSFSRKRSALSKQWMGVCIGPDLVNPCKLVTSAMLGHV